jgi:hypothetical protein
MGDRFDSRFKRNVGLSLAAARLGERGFNVNELVRSALRGPAVGEFIRLTSLAAYDQKHGRELPSDLDQLATHFASEVSRPTLGESYADFLTRIVPLPELQAFGRQAAGWLQEAELEDIGRVPASGVTTTTTPISS